MRGYQKKVIFLKNTGSALFEEACFVIRSDEMAEGKTEADMISEASRIIEENTSKKKRFKLTRLLSLIISFVCGGLVTFLFTILIL
ncbi:MAG: hypothetical protein J6Q68_04045 [Clostridia bacterium]|nr:hypothetical protein [Clostridia bacterium]